MKERLQSRVRELVCLLELLTGTRCEITQRGRRTWAVHLGKLHLWYSGSSACWKSSCYCLYMLPIPLPPQGYVSLLSFRSFLGLLHFIFFFCILTSLLSLSWKYLSLKEINTQCSTFSSVSMFLLSVNSAIFSEMWKG